MLSGFDQEIVPKIQQQTHIYTFPALQQFGRPKKPTIEGPFQALIAL